MKGKSWGNSFNIKFENSDNTPRGSSELSFSSSSLLIVLLEIRENTTCSPFISIKVFFFVGQAYEAWLIKLSALDLIFFHFL